MRKRQLKTIDGYIGGDYEDGRGGILLMECGELLECLKVRIILIKKTILLSQGFATYRKSKYDDM